MAWGFLAHASGQSSDQNTVTTATLTSTGATALFAVVGVLAASGSGIGVTDSKGNSWTLDKTITDGATRTTLVFRSSNPASVGTLHTVTVTGATGKFPAVDFLAFNGGTATSPLDQTNGASGSAATLQPGSVTPAAANELVLTGICCSGTPTISGGYTLEASSVNTGNAVGIGTAFQIQTSATATNPTWSGLTGAAAAAIVTYTLAGGSAGNMFLLF